MTRARFRSCDCMVVVLLLLLCALTTAGCAEPQRKPPPARPPTGQTGVADHVPGTVWWYTPKDRACPAFRSERACRVAIDDECVRRRGSRHMCAH